MRGAAILPSVDDSTIAMMRALLREQRSLQHEPPEQIIQNTAQCQPEAKPTQIKRNPNAIAKQSPISACTDQRPVVMVMSDDDDGYDDDGDDSLEVLMILADS